MSQKNNDRNKLSKKLSDSKKIISQIKQNQKTILRKNKRADLSDWLGPKIMN